MNATILPSSLPYPSRDDLVKLTRSFAGRTGSAPQPLAYMPICFHHLKAA